MRSQTLGSLLWSALLLCALGVPVAQSGTTGRISGRVLDAKKQPLAGATVLVPAFRAGAITDADGRFSIQNAPPGLYEVKVSMLGYRPVAVQGVQVSADNTVTVDATLQESPVELAEVVVKAERPVVDVNQTSQLASVTRETIAQLPVQDLQDVVNLQAGVVDGHFRGGRLGEVQYQVDGVSVNNAYDNSSSLRLDRSLLQEVQVISGTFDAEYGQAMSGVVNAVLRRGSDRFEWSAETYLGSYVYPGSDRRQDYTFRPAEIQNYQLSLSGPMAIAKTTYLFNVRGGINDNWVRGTVTFLPTDESDFENKVFYPTGDGDNVALGYAHDLSGLIKLSTRPNDNVEIGYQAVAERIYGRRANWAFRINPFGQSLQRNLSLVHGFDWTHTLSKATYYQLNLRQNISDYKDMVYDDVYDPGYDAAGPPTGDVDYENGAFVQGVDFTRFSQRTNALLVKGSYTSELNARNRMKLGLEAQWPSVSFGNPGTLTFVSSDSGQALVRHVDEPPDFPGVTTYYPVLASSYAQDELEWNDLRFRGGLRLDYFDANSTVPSDPANPANSIAAAPESHPEQVDPTLTLSPRLGVSYPITRGSALYFAYGHFYQMPALGQIYTNSDYSVLNDLQAGGISFGVMGNPAVKPERTVQYQFGFKQALSDDIGLDVSIFYKDVRDLLGVEFVETYNGAEYARLTNVDFGSVRGVTVTLDQRNYGSFSSTLDYTWQMAQGNSSDPRETATRAAAGEDPRPRQVPFNWDQRNTLNLTLTLARPASYIVSAVVRVGSGQPYTPVVETGFGSGLETNSGRKPASWLVDLRGERPTRVSGFDLNLFARIFNLFDTRNFNSPVFSSTGSPYYSRFPTQDEVALTDPSRYYAPRRIELGVTLRGPRTAGSTAL